MKLHRRSYQDRIKALEKELSACKTIGKALTEIKEEDYKFPTDTYRIKDDERRYTKEYGRIAELEKENAELRAFKAKVRKWIDATMFENEILNMLKKTLSGRSVDQGV
jgi:hypothetical protein